jgi:hypothetical protein
LICLVARVENHGGERGIRTPGALSGTDAFEASGFNHSPISPCAVAASVHFISSISFAGIPSLSRSRKGEKGVSLEIFETNTGVSARWTRWACKIRFAASESRDLLSRFRQQKKKNAAVAALFLFPFRFFSAEAVTYCLAWFLRRRPDVRRD